MLLNNSQIQLEKNIIIVAYMQFNGACMLSTEPIEVQILSPLSWLYEKVEF